MVCKCGGQQPLAVSEHTQRKGFRVPKAYNELIEFPKYHVEFKIKKA